MDNNKPSGDWVKVVFADECPPCSDCEEPVCEACDTHYADCTCPGPTQDDEYEYHVDASNVMWARPIERAEEVSPIAQAEAYLARTQAAFLSSLTSARPHLRLVEKGPLAGLPTDLDEET